MPQITHSYIRHSQNRSQQQAIIIIIIMYEAGRTNELHSHSLESDQSPIHHSAIVHSLELLSDITWYY